MEESVCPGKPLPHASMHFISRTLHGMANAAASGAGLGIMMELYPEKKSFVMACTETAVGIGYTIGR